MEPCHPAQQPSAVVLIDGGNALNSVVTFDLVNGSVGTLTLDSGDELDVGGAHSLSIFVTADISGNISNSGDIENAGGTISNGGSIFNFGMLNNNGTLGNSGDIENAGGKLSNGGSIFNFGMLNNNGTLLRLSTMPAAS